MRDLSHQANWSALLILALCGATGCQSAGTRLARLNPWSRSAAETSVIARSAPQLPSAQATPAEGAPVVATATPATGNTAPGFSPASTSTIAGAPSAAYPTTTSVPTATPGTAPAYPSTAPASAAPATPVSPTNTAVAASGPGAGPYNPSGYQPTVQAKAPSFQPDRYAGLGSRYGTVASATQAPSVTPSVAPATPSASYGNRYGAVPSGLGSPANSLATTPAASLTPTDSPVSTPLPAYPSSAGQSSPVTAPSAVASGNRYGLSAPPAAPVSPPSKSSPSSQVASVQPAAAEVQLSAPTGQYRPGGTSSYPVSVAARPEAPSSAYPTSAYPGSTSSPAGAPQAMPTVPPATPSYR